jgi:hypothetical protein
MNPASVPVIIIAAIGTALLVAALVLRGQPRARRLILAYMGALFFVYGGLEFFGIIRLASP